MDRIELFKEFNRIIEVGIVNAKHDTQVLKEVELMLARAYGDLVYVSSCKNCKNWDDCDPHAEPFSEPFEMWHDCGPFKDNWEWRYEDGIPDEEMEEYERMYEPTYKPEDGNM